VHYSSQKHYNPRFIQPILASAPGQAIFESLQTGSGREGLNFESIKKIELRFPSSAEQTKIADFLSLIDRRIQTQNKIIEDLKSLKSILSKSIFERMLTFETEEKQPFPDWGYQKIGEICKIKRGASPRPISSPRWFDEKSKIGWVRISDVTRSGKFLEITEQYLSDEGVAKSRLVKSDSLIMSICATIGKPIYTKFDVCIHDGFVVFEDLTLNKEYLYYYLDYIQLNWYRYGQPGIQVNLNTEIVNDETIPIPCIEEQRRIVEFLTAFDNKANGEITILQYYQQQKEYFLKNLFA
jgi:type I restriction enzyme S subunit